MCMLISSRYDVVPDDLVLNNTIQISYGSDNTAASPVEYDAVAVLDDTKFVPVLHREMIEYDVKFELNAFFDVSHV